MFRSKTKIVLVAIIIIALATVGCVSQNEIKSETFQTGNVSVKEPPAVLPTPIDSNANETNLKENIPVRNVSAGQTQEIMSCAKIESMDDLLQKVDVLIVVKPDEIIYRDIPYNKSLSVGFDGRNAGVYQYIFLSGGVSNAYRNGSIGFCTVPYAYKQGDQEKIVAKSGKGSGLIILNFV